MSQIIKAFMGMFFLLFMAAAAMGILSAYMEVMNAQDMQARIVDEIENSDFNEGVIRDCFERCSDAGYQLAVTLFLENSAVLTAHSQNEFYGGYGNVDMAKVELKFPFQIEWFGINNTHTFVSYAK